MGRAKRIALTAGVLWAIASVAMAQSQIPWLENWQEAQSLAERHHRLVLVHFWSDNCPPCWKLDRTVFNQPEVIRALSTNYVPLKVNVSQDPDLTRHFQIDRWPTDVIVTPSGQELYRGISPLDVNRYIATLDQVAAHARVGMVAAGSPSTELAVPMRGFADGPGNAFAQHAGQPTAPGGGATFPHPGTSAAPTAPSPRGGMLPEQPASYTQRGGGAFPVPDGPPTTPPQPTHNPFVAPSERSEQAVLGAPFRSPAAPIPPAAPTWAPPGNSSFPVPPATGPFGPPPSADAPASAAGTPADRNRPEPASPPSWPPPPTLNPPVPAPPDVAMEGYCSVTLVDQEKWVKGDARWGAVHQGRVYLFAGEEEQRRFLADFDRFAPALSGYDPVRYATTGQLTDGRRAHGVFYRGQVYLFADEQSLEQFWSAPERFAPVVRAEAQRHATRPSGPGSPGPPGPGGMNR